MKSKKFTREQKVASFIAKIDIRGAEACWPWKGCVYGNALKYGAFVWRGKLRGANRVMWEIANGCECPVELEVLHRCDNSMCVNPAHLWIGTHQENMQDAKRKDRHARGERNRRHKLTEAQAKEILANPPRMGHGGNTAEYAAKYGVRVGTIAALLARRSWKHLDAQQF